MKVTLLAFARLRELTGFSQQRFELADGARVDDAWDAVLRQAPQASELRATTRAARNGVVVAGSDVLHDGDELALLPPVGGG